MPFFLSDEIAKIYYISFLQKKTPLFDTFHKLLADLQLNSFIF